jgi:hypothetical protein
VLAYRNSELIARFQEAWHVDEATTRQIFADLKRYLWVAGPTKDRVTPPFVIDEMWHMFLVFTAEYARFCTRYFGTMLHHDPDTVRSKRAAAERLARDPAKAKARYAKLLEREISYVYDELGEDCVRRWYTDYTNKDFFASRRVAT